MYMTRNNKFKKKMEKKKRRKKKKSEKIQIGEIQARSNDPVSGNQSMHCNSNPPFLCFTRQLF